MYISLIRTLTTYFPRDPFGTAMANIVVGVLVNEKIGCQRKEERRDNIVETDVENPTAIFRRGSQSWIFETSAAREKSDDR